MRRIYGCSLLDLKKRISARLHLETICTNSYYPSLRTVINIYFRILVVVICLVGAVYPLMLLGSAPIAAAIIGLVVAPVEIGRAHV